MKTKKMIIVGLLAAVIATIAFAAPAYARMGGGMMGGGMMGGYGYGYGYGYNSSPYGTQTIPTAPTTPSTQYYQPVYPFQFGGGCMGRMGGYGFGGMMNRFGYSAPYTYTGTPLTITQANTIAQNYVASIGNLDLAVEQVEEYQANFYVQVNEVNSGNGAFELLINKYTGSIYPEMGPNMMWNTKYGMMRGGALGGIYGTPTTTMTVTPTQATANAQQWLTTNIPATTTGDLTTFYGYYTIEVLNGATPYGMLSVNGYTGQIWHHTWHGTFVQELQVS